MSNLKKLLQSIIGQVNNSIKKTPQILTEDSKMQTRANLGLYRIGETYVPICSATLSSASPISVSTTIDLIVGSTYLVQVIDSSGEEKCLTYVAEDLSNPLGTFIGFGGSAFGGAYSQGVRVIDMGTYYSISVDASFFSLPCDVTIKTMEVGTIPIEEEYIPKSIARTEDIYYSKLTKEQSEQLHALVDE